MARRTSTIDTGSHGMLSLSGDVPQHPAFSPPSHFAMSTTSPPYCMAGSAPTAASSQPGLDGLDQRDFHQMQQSWAPRTSVVSAYSSASSMADDFHQYPQRTSSQPHQQTQQLQHQHVMPSSEKPWRFVDPNAPAMPSSWHPAGMTAFPSNNQSVASFAGPSWQEAGPYPFGQDGLLKRDDGEDDYEEEDAEGMSPGGTSIRREKASRRQGVTCDQCREKHLRCDLADRIAEVEERKKRSHAEIDGLDGASQEAKAVCTRCSEKGFVCNKTTAAPSRRYPRPSRTGKRIEQAR